MTRKKLKLAWVENEKSRVRKLKKIRIGLMKKVKELTILCDVRACIIMFSPNEVEPMVWPSAEKARDLLAGFFALPEIEKKKKETSLESYLKEKTTKVQEQSMKIHKKHMGHVIDQLMVQLHRGRGIYDLDLSEIYALISFSRDNILLCKKELGFAQCSPLREPPMPPFEQFVELGATTNDERAWKTNEETKKVSIGNALRENQSHYLIDKWVFASPETTKPMVSYNENRNHVLYQGNRRLDIEPVDAPMLNFHGLVGSVSQQLEHHQNMIDNPTVAMGQPRQHPFDCMSREIGGVQEEGSTVNDGNLQEAPVPNGTIINTYVRSFDINKVWSSVNNNDQNM